jgi:two-component system sensor histidine kinase CpxA
VRSLFVKILLWFILTVVVAVSGTFYVSNILSERRQAAQQQQQPTQFRRFRYQLQDARDAWLTDGVNGLERVLARVKETDELEAHLADSAGHDLISGRDWSKEISVALAAQGRGRGPGRGDNASNPLFPFFRVDEPPRPPQGPMVSQTKTGAKFYFIVLYPPNPNPPPAQARIQVLKETWWMLGIFAVLCYVLARHVTSPIRAMQKTIERFGQGDFTARVNSRRSDELGQLGRTVDRMAERIDNLLKAQRRLLQDISHELRSPLARLGVAVELARGGANLDSSLNRIEREGTRLNTLVGELIQVTRGEGDPQGLATEQIRLDELVGTIVDDSRIEAEKRHVILNASLSKVTMEGNPELLRRAIENLVRNAIRYSPEETTVDISLSKVGSVYRISVRDHGAGVPEESLSSIFDPFYRVEKDRGRTSGGVGLGLAIAKRAVELHRGTMRATNVKPGLRVEIDLPAPGVAAEESMLAGARA